MRPTLRSLVSILSLVLLPGWTAVADVPPAPALPVSSTLVVLVQGLPAVNGTVVALLFPSDHGFPAKEAKAAQRQAVKVVSATAEIRFPNLATGTYAVTVYHDLNDNGKLDTNWIGIPKEPVGVSNNPRPRMGPPRFSDASFASSDLEHKLAVNLATP